MQPCQTPFPILNQSVVPCPVLTVASLPVYSFLRRQGGLVVPFLTNFPQFVVIHIVRGLSVVNEAEVGVFLELPWFLHDPMNVGNLISYSFASSKPSLYIWNFSVHIQLKPSLKDFENNLTSMGSEYDCLVF